MAYTKQVKAANVLNNAFSSSYVGGDGKELCAMVYSFNPRKLVRRLWDR
jgi:hypothetical protein